MVIDNMVFDVEGRSNEVGFEVPNNVEEISFVGWAEAIEVIKQWAEEEH